jgi:hypothetical protein
VGLRKSRREDTHSLLGSASTYIHVSDSTFNLQPFLNQNIQPVANQSFVTSNLMCRYLLCTKFSTGFVPNFYGRGNSSIPQESAVLRPWPSSTSTKQETRNKEIKHSKNGARHGDMAFFIRRHRDFVLFSRLYCKLLVTALEKRCGRLEFVGFRSGGKRMESVSCSWEARGRTLFWFSACVLHTVLRFLLAFCGDTRAFSFFVVCFSL